MLPEFSSTKWPRKIFTITTSKAYKTTDFSTTIQFLSERAAMGKLEEWYPPKAIWTWQNDYLHAKYFFIFFFSLVLAREVATTHDIVGLDGVFKLTILWIHAMGDDCICISIWPWMPWICVYFCQTNCLALFFLWEKVSHKRVSERTCQKRTRK
jgi:hypothetical protein